MVLPATEKVRTGKQRNSLKGANLDAFILIFWLLLDYSYPVQVPVPSFV